MYKASGTQEDYVAWFDAIIRRVSLGGAAARAVFWWHRLSVLKLPAMLRKWLQTKGRVTIWHGVARIVKSRKWLPD